MLMSVKENTAVTRTLCASTLMEATHAFAVLAIQEMGECVKVQNTTFKACHTTCKAVISLHDRYKWQTNSCPTSARTAKYKLKT